MSSSPSSPGAATPAGSTRQQPQQQHAPGGLRELGRLAAWSVTSAKPGNGVELLRDGSTDTYWQSDGAQPHLVNIQFSRRLELTELHLYTDIKADESYTPNRLAVRAGSCHHDLRDVCAVELREPSGWTVIRLGPPGGRGIRAHALQVAVLANHQNGRDTHIRQLLVYGPAASGSGSLMSGGSLGGGFAADGCGTTSQQFSCFSVVR